VEPSAESSLYLRRRRLLGRLRVVVLLLVVLWLLSPPAVRDLIPVWLPFLAALSVEAQFFASALREGGLPAPSQRRRRALTPRDYPDPTDVSDPATAWDAEFDAEGNLIPRPLPAERRRSRTRAALEVVAMLTLVATLLLLLGHRPGWGSVSSAQRVATEQRLSTAATALAGHRAQVHCDTNYQHVGYLQDADGLAYVGGRDAYLTPEICYSLYRLLHHHVDSFDATSRALKVLGHEAAHLRGVSSESAAECAGIRSGVQLGVDFGLSHAEAQKMMHYRLVQNSSDFADAPAYIVHGCHLP
jgi:hypothetical protein